MEKVDHIMRYSESLLDISHIYFIKIKVVAAIKSFRGYKIETLVRNQLLFAP